MNILSAASELYPLIKTGGLADVANNLPIALKNRRQAVRVMLPAYQSVLSRQSKLKTIAELSIDKHQIRILETHLAPSKLKIWLLDCPALFDRPGSPYVDDKGHDWADNAERFSIFCQAVARVAIGDTGMKWRADIVHCNDWQTGLVPVYLNDVPSPERPKTVFTIHNLAFQGLFPYSTFQALTLPEKYWHADALEFYGQLSFIKGGLVFSDQITTVSPTYAEEITRPEFGYGLEGVLQTRSASLVGLLNGIDTSEWNPKTDRLLVKNYSASSLRDKHMNKRSLQQRFGLPVSAKALLIGVVSRLFEQKGIDLILDALPQCGNLPLQLVVLGTGDNILETQLLEATELYPNMVSVEIAYDEQLAHQIIAGADVFAMPSRYEPCGLTQLYSLRYGTLPLVRKVGGLADTVVDTTVQSIANNSADGFVFVDASADALAATIRRAVSRYTDRALWQKLQTTAKRKDYSWGNSARNYLRLYQSLLAAD